MHIAIKTDTLFIKNYLIAYKKETRKKQFTFTVTGNTPVIDINSVFSDLLSFLIIILLYLGRPRPAVVINRLMMIMIQCLGNIIG